MATRDDVEPKGSWEFDEEVTEAFSDMLERSIPQYDMMRWTVTDLAETFIVRLGLGGLVVDLGCSRGDALGELEERVGNTARYVGADASGPMVAAARQRFEDKPHVKIEHLDLRERYPRLPRPADVTLCVLTLQFTPMEYRQRILREVRRYTRGGGALIIVEKVLGASADIDEKLVDRYHALKGERGYSPEQIERKRLALEGVLVPTTAAWTEDLLRQAGFREVDCFWRMLNFAGWLALA